MMTVDFKNAAMRHAKDADLLFDKKRYANADHFYGLAAECALKAVMVGLDPSIINTKGDLKDQSDRKHIDKLWNHFRIFIQNRNTSIYLSCLSTHNNPFSSWQIDDRYKNEKLFIKNNVLPHKTVVNSQITNLLATARMDGIL
jgi:hypothetical protein